MIVRWYVDDGISGDETEKRKDFQRMHADATNGRDFEVILCWDQDRFGRFNSMEAGYWIHPLMRAGVRLETVTEGPVDWNDFAGRMVYSIKQEGEHQFLIDLSGNVARRQIQNAKDGYLCGQAAPYGFDRMIVDETGQHRQRVHNGEAFVKPRSWHVTLVPSDDPLKVKWAKWLFSTYANNDIGLRAMANELNRRGIPGPRGGKWWIGTIRALLGNEAFIGTFVWGKRGEGKYHRVAGGEIRRRNGNGKRLDDNPPETWTVVPDAWPALVDAATFNRVQAKLADRRAMKGHPSTTTTSPDHYMLSGVVHCAHCGAKMFGHRRTRRKRGKTYESRRYVCSTYFTQGKACCGCHSIDQDILLDVLVRKLQEAVLCGGNRDELRRRVIDRLEARQAADPADVEALRGRVAQLDGELEHGTRRLLRAPDDVADLLGAELAATRRERDRLAGELAAMESAKPTDVEAAADRVVDRLWSLGAELEKAKPARLRELLRRMVARIDLWFDSVQKRTRTEHPFLRGCIDLRPDPSLVVFNSVNRGDWI